MHRNRTWLVDSTETVLRTQRNRILPIEGGDGSTLTLDFTTGQLDPRLTFTRASDATFINSSGLVQWANANIVRRSEDCTNWGGSQNITPTADAALAPNGTQTADQLNLLSTSYRYQVTAANKVIGGQRYTGSIYVRAVSGTAQVNLRIANTADGNNGVAVTQTVGETWTRLQGSFTLASNGTLIDIGLDQRTGIPNAGPGVAANVYVWGLQLQPGGTAGEYLQTTTTENYNTPRFDYDPTTLAPKGLLIEGAATNLFNWSETFDTTGGVTNWNWSALNVTRGTVTTTNPTGASATVIKIEETTTNGIHAPLTVPAVLASTAYTFSVWAKAVERTFVQLFENGGSGATSMVNLSTGAVVSESTAGITTVTALGTTGWYRISMRLTTIVGQTTANCQLRLSTNGTTTSYAGTTGSGIYIWGAQLEAGSGASSYIPTGASTVQRLQDLLSITSTNFSSWWTSNNPASFLIDFSSTSRALANHIFRIADSSGSAYGYQSYFNSTTMPMQVRAVMTSTSSSDVAIGSNLAANTRTKVGFTIETAALKRFRDGNLANTLNTPTLPPNTMTQMYIGGTTSFGNASADFHIRQFKYWPITLSDAAMQGFTT